jgi:hypothetical protein
VLVCRTQLFNFDCFKPGGEDGQSSNNCVVSGGQFNLFSTANALDSTEPEVTNVLIQGVTFEKGKSSGLLFVAPGNVTLEDCIIRVRNRDVPRRFVNICHSCFW